MNPPYKTVYRFKRDLKRLIDIDQDPVLVAVSGGADSIALLLLMRAVLEDRCYAATVDHGLRPAAADEARFVADLCEQRGIDHVILTGDMPPRVNGTTNLSARARALRYRLLEQESVDLGEVWVATAHHADDQLETLIMRLNRGAGVGGLAGIRSSGMRFVRPLLGWRRAELEAVVRHCEITPVADPSNVDDRFDRARLRKALSQVDWLDANHVALSAAALGEADDALRWTASRLFSERTIVDGERLILEPTGLPDELRRRLVLLCLARFEPDRTPTGPALMRVLEALYSDRPAMIGNIRVTVGRAERGKTRWTFAKAPPRRPHRSA